MINIEVFADPEITIVADDIEVCIGETVDITATVSGGTGDCNIQWQRRPAGGVFVNVHSGETTVTAGLAFLSTPGVYEYQAIYSCDGASCAEITSDITTIEVFEDPSITIEADELEVCLGATVEITPTVSGGAGNCEIEWERRVGTSGPWISTTNGIAESAFLSAPGTYQYRAMYVCDGASCDEVTSNICLLYTSPSPRDS